MNAKKYLHFLFLLSLFLICGPAQAIPHPEPSLAAIRAEVTNQLAIANNNVGGTNALLIKILRGALRTIDRAKSNDVAEVRTLAVLEKKLGATTLTNDFVDPLYTTAGLYLSEFLLDLDELLARANATVFGESHDSALGSVERMTGIMEGARTNFMADFPLALQFLAKAAVQRRSTIKAVEKAEQAPLPPMQFSAAIQGSTFFDSHDLSPGPLPHDFFGSYGDPGNYLQFAAFEVHVLYESVDTIILVQEMVINIPDLVDGATTTYGFGPNGQAAASYAERRVGLRGTELENFYPVYDGTLTVTVDKASHTAAGTFQCLAIGSFITNTVTISGKFSIVWQH